MGAPSIKRNAVRYARESMRKLKHLKVPTISIAVNIHTKEVLGAGIDHSTVVTHLKVPEGSWEIKEVPFWR